MSIESTYKFVTCLTYVFPLPLPTRERYFDLKTLTLYVLDTVLSCSVHTIDLVLKRRTL